MNGRRGHRNIFPTSLSSMFGFLLLVAIFAVYTTTSSTTTSNVVVAFTSTSTNPTNTQRVAKPTCGASTTSSIIRPIPFPFTNCKTSSSLSSSFTSTMLHLKIPVDNKDDDKSNQTSKGIKINPGAFKGAAYAGSIVIAVFLPVAFLIWAALK
ncbi:hypothetical protein IV203_015919 [Nitzschia inconspicua]|uniref:Uncharacterized protein n=1 Tax=Nitzschia inconspicua TaxID=303405 RepID=A0A9K3LBE4_9STRA|nr:hypothetical protein IV203_015919 [Nitzschia inconspicua]